LSAATSVCQSALVMNADDVLATLKLLDDAGTTTWVDGGWGVDALLGENQPRRTRTSISWSAPTTCRRSGPRW